MKSTGMLSRRQWLLASLGAAFAGCSQAPLAMSRRPGPDWPSRGPEPLLDAWSAKSSQVAESPFADATAASQAPVSSSVTGFSQTVPIPRVIQRASWARMKIVPGRINPMGGINRITLHHEGWKVVRFTDIGHTVERLQAIQKFHIKKRGWGDIGYHFVIDRAGRVWQGRSLAYQGAHVADYNEHNVGMMLLGNFDHQQPSRVQLATAQSMVLGLMARFDVPVHRVYTHQELKPTDCPGRNLQPRLVAMRHAIHLA